VSHSHLPIRHLIKKLETTGRGQPREPGDVRPDWLVSLISNVAALFEPLVGVSRVGYDCQMTDAGWHVLLYLGNTEIVGGPEDGKLDPPAFTVDLVELVNQLDHVDELSWNVFPGWTNDESSDHSLVSLSGQVDSQAVSLQLRGSAPPDAGPAMRLFSDGRCEAT